MKEIIAQFVEKHKDMNFTASYCEIEDLDMYIQTNLARHHLILCNSRHDLNIIDHKHAFAKLFTECNQILEFDGAVYNHEPITRDDHFIAVIDLKTGNFTVAGSDRRSQILEALDRLSVVLDALKFYESKKSIDTKVLTSTYPWLDFSWRGMNKDKFNLDPRYSDVNGWFVLDRNGIWDLTVELDKPTIRLMKRHLPKKVRHRRNRQIAKTESRFKLNEDRAKDNLFLHNLSQALNSKEFKDQVSVSMLEMTPFEKILVNAETGPAKKVDPEYLAHLETVARGQMLRDFLNETLSSRFRADVISGTGLVSIVDITCLHQFDSEDKNKVYYVTQIDDVIRLGFKSNFDPNKDLDSEKVKILESNNIEIEIFDNRLYLTLFVFDREDLNDKIILLADFLKEL